MDVNVGMDLRLWAEAPGAELIPVLERLAGLGYQGVELPLAGQGHSALRLISVAAQDLGLSVLTSARLPPEANPISPEREVRDAAIRYLKARLDESALVGSRMLCGGFFQAHGVFSGRSHTDREWEWSRHCLRAVAEYAAGLEITLALEFQSRFDAYLINTAAGASRMCRDVGAPNMGVLYNTYHAHLEDFNPARALPDASDHLVHVRLGESHRGELGRGQVQFAETFATLDFLDYQGWLVVEARAAGVGPARPENIWRNNFDSPDQLSADAMRLIQQILRMQRQ